MKKDNVKEVKAIIESDDDIVTKLEEYAELTGIPFNEVLEAALHIQRWAILQRKEIDNHYIQFYNDHTIRIKR